ncbi:hypothetical protein Ahy_B03g062137 isoform F [Arachis hypogaea]|uniref:Uncharacterized protein n=1 Tax=Arachis hypogaea TaxID=3818 RepID=A0A444ZT29_ARAHY|nr:hypothetical protein Ahy_B03g062137 isoform F [Arachis hypogaea]
MAVLNTFINFIKVYNMESKHRVKESKHLVEMTKSISTLGKGGIAVLLKQRVVLALVGGGSRSGIWLRNASLL